MNPHKILTVIGMAGMVYMALAMSFEPANDRVDMAGISRMAPGDPDSRNAPASQAAAHDPMMPKWVRDMIVVAIRGTGF